MISLDDPGLAQPQRLFDGDLVERVHRHLDVGGLDPGLVRLDPDLDVVVDDPLDRDQRFHLVLAVCAGGTHDPAGRIVICARAQSEGKRLRFVSSEERGQCNGMVTCFCKLSGP